MMEPDVPSNATHELILDAAERLFSERGYAAVKLQQIADAVKMRHASLYYYAPEGKEQLYMMVMARNLRRHQAGLTEAIAAVGDDFRAQIHAVATWFATQAPLDLGHMVRADMPALTPEHAEALHELSLAALRAPIVAVLQRAEQAGLVQWPNVEFAAMGLVGLLQSVHNIPARYVPDEAARVAVAKATADMLLDGWLKH